MSAESSATCDALHRGHTHCGSTATCPARAAPSAAGTRGATRALTTQAADVDATDRALAERKRPLRPNEVRRQARPDRVRGRQARSADAGRPWRAAPSPRQRDGRARGRRAYFTTGLPSTPAASRSAVCFARTSGLVKISSIATSSERSPAHDVLEAADPAVGQRPLGVVRPLFAPFGGDGMAHEVELARSRIGCLLL